MFYLFHGEDELAIAEATTALRQRLAEADPLADLNATTLDGRRLTLAALREAADALPFMSERRLVVVLGLVGRCNPRGGDRGEGRKALAAGLIDYLPAVPPSTRLVLVEERLEKDNPVLRWASSFAADPATPAEAAVVRAFDPPPSGALPRWIEARARAAGGSIRADAAAALAEALERDGRVNLRMAASEVEKLVTYAGGREVTADDVARLVASIRLESVFRLVDAIGDRDRRAALARLHELQAAGEAPLRLLALITRQFRLLHRTALLLGAGRPAAELPRLLGVPPFVGRKLAAQARRFRTPALADALARLLEADAGIKTGAVDGPIALELLVATLGDEAPTGR